MEEPMPGWGWVVVAVVAADAVAFVAFLRLLRSRSARATAGTARALEGAPAVLEDPGASYRGRTSRREVVGNGHLSLGEEALVFTQWVPHRTITIPRASIVAVDRTRRHAGRIGPAVLRVRYRDETGAEDAVGFGVRDLPRWLSELRAGGSPPP
jgi:hypothetical protein